MLDSNSTQPGVLIIGEGALFDEGITELLTRRTNLTVSHIVYSDEMGFLNIIKRAQPDVSLVCQSGSLDTKHILDSISVSSLIIGLCIFVVRLSSPVIDIYERPILNVGKVPIDREASSLGRQMI